MCLAGVGGFGSHSTWKEQASARSRSGEQALPGKPGLRGYFKKYKNNNKGRAGAFPCSFVSGRTGAPASAEEQDQERDQPDPGGNCGVCSNHCEAGNHAGPG